MNDETLEQIHLKLAFLERANSELSDVVFRQQQEIQILNMRVRELAERMAAGSQGGEERTPEEERPPHY